MNYICSLTKLSLIAAYLYDQHLNIGYVCIPSSSALLKDMVNCQGLPV
jgi:hypothetical protein